MLIALLTGFRERDADKLDGIYSADADWVNAFGSVKKGGPEIVAYLRGLFADDNFNAGTLKAPPTTNIRVLTNDVVLVSAHLQVEGQKLVGGGEIEVRDNFSLRMLQQLSRGRAHPERCDIRWGDCLHVRHEFGPAHPRPLQR